MEQRDQQKEVLVMFLEDVRAAMQMYYQSSGKNTSQATTKRRELGTMPQCLKGHPEHDALYRGYSLKISRPGIGKLV